MDVNKITNRRVQMAAVYALNNKRHIKSLVSLAVATIDQALQRTRKAYVAFSGGKDSLATAALVLTVDPTIPLVWGDDELELPETVDMMRGILATHSGDFLPLKSHATHGGWFRAWHHPPDWREPLDGTLTIPDDQHVWDYMRERWGFRLTFLGTRGDESNRRASHFLRRGPTYFSQGGWRCCPLAGWTNDDVWGFIAVAVTGLAYNGAYDVFDRMRLDDHKWRVGPMPLMPQYVLAEGWPTVYDQLVRRYGSRW